MTEENINQKKKPLTLVLQIKAHVRLHNFSLIKITTEEKLPTPPCNHPSTRASHLEYLYPTSTNTTATTTNG